MSWTAKRDDLPGTRPLVGRYIRLEPLAWPQPGTKLSSKLAAEPPEQWEFMTIGPFTEPLELADHLQAANQKADQQVMVLLLPDGEPVGMASFLRVRPEHGSAELGFILFSKDLQGTRAGTEAMFLMMEHLFDFLGWRRCEWKCHALNRRSRRAAERLGFHFEGTFRQDMWLKGRNRDTCWFSIIDSEWSGLKPAFQAWLADENFDEKGRQLRRLEDFRR